MVFRKRGKLRPEDEAEIEEALNALDEIRAAEISDELKPVIVTNPFLKLLENNETANEDHISE